jgi:hypothetical protein
MQRRRRRRQNRRRSSLSSSEDRSPGPDDVTPQLRHPERRPTDDDVDEDVTACKRPVSVRTSQVDQLCNPSPLRHAEHDVYVASAYGRVPTAGNPPAPLSVHNSAGRSRTVGGGFPQEFHPGRECSQGVEVHPTNPSPHVVDRLPVACAADVSVNNRSRRGLDAAGGATPPNRRGQGLQKKDSNASSSSRSRVSREGSGRGLRVSGGLEQFGLAILSTPENSGQYSHYTDHNHSTALKTTYE